MRQREFAERLQDGCVSDAQYIFLGFSRSRQASRRNMASYDKFGLWRLPLSFSSALPRGTGSQ